MARDYLVLVRAGLNSLHSQWLAQDPERNWDCWVSWYCNPAAGSRVAIEYESSGGDNKLEGFLMGVSARNIPLEQYRYVALLDDDLEFAPGDISKTFEFCCLAAIDLAQPALRWGSNVNHDVTLYNPVTDVRRVTFVEVMMPFFSLNALRFLEPTFASAKSTWGVDYAWASRLAHRPAAQGGVAIIDAVRVHHTKPFDTTNGAFYRKLAAMGVNAGEEYRRIKQEHPSFGGLKTLKGGHLGAGMWRHCPCFLLNVFVWLSESIKKRCHRRQLQNASKKL